MVFDALLQDLATLGSVILIDLVLAGDNAVVVGMIVVGLPLHRRRHAMVLGIALALVLRIAFSLVAVQILSVIGLLLAGGILLMWVAWKLWRELRDEAKERRAAQHADPAPRPRLQPKSLPAAVWQITLADVSMSLDNVLAVAGTARDNVLILAFGLVLSVALMGVAAAAVARLLNRYHWIAYLGLAVIAYVAGVMIYDGTGKVLAAIADAVCPGSGGRLVC